jgi:regulatory protein
VKTNESGSLEKARQYVFLLLKYRLRSEKEIADRLVRKKFPPEVIKDTIAFLKEKRFIDDSSFARAWLQSRIKRPLGLRRLKQELRFKGIDKEIIESNIQRIKENYSETEVVQNIVEEKFRKMRNIEPQKAKSRIYAYLLRRGFSPDVCLDAINRLIVRDDTL